jgi:hypothetical protein
VERDAESERMREEEESVLRPNQYKGQDSSLVDALPCPKGISKGDTLQVLRGATPSSCPQCPAIHLGRHDE